MLNVEKNVKFHSNPTEVDQYTAKNVIPSEDQQEDTNFASELSLIIHNLLFLTFYLHTDQQS